MRATKIRKIFTHSLISILLLSQANTMLAADRQPLGLNNKNSSNIFNFILTSNNINTITKNDFEKLIKSFSGKTGCNFKATMRNMSDGLVIKLIGHNFIKDGIPKTTTSAQNRFYELALQSDSIPTNEDKNTLLRVLFNDSCLQPDFGYDSKLIRDFLANDVRIKSELKLKIAREQLTYKEISKQLDGSQLESKEFEEEIEKFINKNPELAEDLGKAMMPIFSFIFELASKYDIKLL